MTTVAWDGKTLAVDSQSSEGNLLGSLKQKKLYKSVGEFQAVAIAGEIKTHPVWLEWLRGGATPKDFPENALNDGAILCITKKGKALIYTDDSPYPEKAGKIDSLGSGRFIARGAMHAGKSAVEAVRIACKVDLYTGGKVQSHKVDKQ